MVGPDDHPSRERELHELRCLQELARQLLPLRDAGDVARDGLLCIAGITGIGCGALYWGEREDSPEPWRLLSHFGASRHPGIPATLEPEAWEPFAARPAPWRLRALLDVPGSAATRAALAAWRTFAGDAWLLPLTVERRQRGLLILGPSLVTGTVLDSPSWLLDLAEVLQLGLQGSRPEVVSPTREDGPGRTALGAPASAASGAAVEAGHEAPTRSEASAAIQSRLEALRRRYPATRELVGESEAVLAVLEDLVSYATTDYTVLIQGETGTGKELVASLLHKLGRRASGPFEAVDCSAIPRELIESELFGHVKGAFTGATRDFRGAFERADGGTLFLDEIGDMDLRSQTRLLRVLQEGRIRRLGGDRAVPVDARVVAATNRDLVQMVREGTFREDLYYRIHVCPLHLPALRDRGADRILLFDHFMAHQAQAIGRTPRPLEATARQHLLTHPLPGNVRQLQNVVRRLLVRRDDGRAIEARELASTLSQSSLGEAAPRGGEVGSKATPGGARTGDGEAAARVEDVGAWVVEELRRERFNLLATARRLQARRAAGEGRERVPVYDRGALDAYLCGEFCRCLVAADFDAARALGALAGSETVAPRLQRKMLAYATSLRRLGADATARARERFLARIPERYHVVVERVARALDDGRWLPGPAQGQKKSGEVDSTSPE